MPNFEIGYSTLDILHFARRGSDAYHKDCHELATFGSRSLDVFRTQIHAFDELQPSLSFPQFFEANLDFVDKIIARLGGRGPRDELSLDLTYGEVVGILQKLTETGQLVASDGPRLWPVAFMLQEPRPVQNLINAAPVIGAADLQPAAKPDLADAARTGEMPMPR